MEDADNILENKYALSATMDNVLSDKSKIKDLQNLMDQDPSVKRYVGRQTRNQNVVKSVGSLSMSEKIRIKRTYENSGNCSLTSGMRCVLIKGKNQYKEVFFPSPDKWENANIIMLSSGLTLSYRNVGGKINRKASKIAGQNIFGEAYLHKTNMEDFTLKEFEVIDKQ